MIIDCHCHMFTAQVIKNVTSRAALMSELRLSPEAESRSDAGKLEQSAVQNGVEFCILFPTAPPESVRKENDRHLSAASLFKRIKTLATLHPRLENIEEEARRMMDAGIRGFKFCSFSQRFDIDSDETEKMFAAIKRAGIQRNINVAIAFDTFNRAHVHFGAKAQHLTTPEKLNRVVERHRDINFLAAHMGGLAADFDKIRNCLAPAPNLFLDTSNAAHVLEPGEFIQLLQSHGPGHILFGTDWPFFDHAAEIKLIDSLLDRAGFDKEQKESVFRKNAEKLFL